MLVFAGAAAPALATPNLLASGGFEGGATGSLAGWKGMRAVLTLRPDGRGGGHAARVARSAGARTYSIVAAPNPAAAVAERLYRARAYLRSGRPGRTVCLKLIELTPAGRVAGQAIGLPQGHGGVAGPPGRQLHREAHRRRDLAAGRADRRRRAPGTASRSTRCS